MNMNTNQEMNTKELDLNEAETVSGGKLRYKEIEKYLTEEQKKEDTKKAEKAKDLEILTEKLENVKVHNMRR